MSDFDYTKPPTCYKCGKKAEARDAGVCKSIPYWYCTSCKIEVSGLNYTSSIDYSGYEYYSYIDPDEHYES